MKVPSYHTGTMLIIASVLLLLVISVSGNAGLWLMSILLVFCGLTLLTSLITQLREAIIKPSHRLYAKDFTLKFMATLMGFLLVLGTILYLYVFYTVANDEAVYEDVGHEVQFSNAEYLLRSLICSLDLFMLDVDSNLLDRLDHHPGLKGWLSVQAVVSFACTVAMLVWLVYSRVHAYYRLNYRTRITDAHNHLYLFFGNNEPSSLLIKDITRNDPKAVAIIIDEANLKDDDNDEWAGIVGLIAHKHKVFKEADKVGALVSIASQPLMDIDEEVSSRADFDAFGYLGISRIRKFIERLTDTTDPQLHIFFMGDDEEHNIRNIIVLAKDRTIMELAQNDAVYHRIYCHARLNGPNRVIQDVALKKHLNIKIVDSSHIAVELLKYHPEYHPVNSIKTIGAGQTLVYKPFKALLIGFGEVGRDAFRFLYEFTTFVDSEDHNRRCRFECQIVDSNLESIEGTFKSTMPAIFDPRLRTEHNAFIDFHAIDHNSTEFYDKVLTDEFITTLNYVVISIADADEAITLASRIFNKARRSGRDMSTIRIFVRCSDDKKVDSLLKITAHYNFGYADKEKNTPVIQLFGQPDMTYTYDLVVSDRFVEAGKKFQAKYSILSGDGGTWDERHKKLTGNGIPDIDKLRKLRRQESQDRANALHAGTKLILLKQAMDSLYAEDGLQIDWNSFLHRYFNDDGSADVVGSQKDITYPELTPDENRIIRQLAMLEHLRWNAAHELMGYVFNTTENSCNEQTMRHNCLCTWDQLDAQSNKITDWPCDYKRYDYCVVDTTIALNRQTLKTSNLIPWQTSL
ncbi:MAG: hypothetical protein NC098_00830 [Lachnoclostridium sp.]|nr:hypothetical protein [Lachnoclostridium sp.]